MNPVRASRCWFGVITLLSASAGAESIGTSASGLSSASAQAVSGGTPELGNDGLLRYSVPLDLPAARGGRVTPQVSLAYAQTTPTGMLGHGWSIPLSWIEVDTLGRTPTSSGAVSKGVFTAPRFVFVQGEGRQPLVSVSATTYRVEVEAKYLSFSQQANGWRAVDGLGTQYLFRVVQRDGDGVALRWYLSDVIDTNQNWTRWGYRTVASGFCVDTEAREAVTPRVIEWNNTAVQSDLLFRCDPGPFKDALSFVYEKRPDTLQLSDLAGAYSVYDRLQEIRLTSAGTRIQTWHLHYTTAFASRRSLLSAVYTSGLGCTASFVGDDTTLACPADQVLPPTRFTYSGTATAFEASQTVMNDTAVALPDHLSYLSSFVYTDDSLFGGQAEERAGMVDLDGDGRPDRIGAHFLSPNLANNRQWFFHPSQTGTAGRAATRPFDAARNFGVANDVVMTPSGDNLIDMNGDGRPDVLRESGWTVRYNTGSDFNATAVPWRVSGVTAWLAAHPTSVSSQPARDALKRCGLEITCKWIEDVFTNITQHQVLAAVRDLTGDGIPDYVVAATDTYATWWVFPGYIDPASSATTPAGGFTDEPLIWRFPGNSATVFLPIETTHVVVTGAPTDRTITVEGALMDLNGDGLLDYRGRLGSFLNTGRGFAASFGPAGPISTQTTTATTTNQTQSMMDVNGDGLPDSLATVIDADGTHHLDVRFNTGSAFTSYAYAWLENDLWNHHGLLVGAWDGNSVGSRFQRAGLVDLTGDGLLDYVAQTTAGGWEVYRNPGGTGGCALPEQLVGVSNGVGGGFTVSYRPSTQLTNVRLPSVRHVVSQITPTLAGSFARVPAATRYDWADGSLTRDPARNLWAFRGFATVTATRIGGNSTVTTYNVTNPDLTQRPVTVEHRDRLGCRFARASFDWASYSPRNVTTAGSVRIPYASASTETRYDGSTCAATSISQSQLISALDDFGNVTVAADLGGSSTTDDVYRLVTYATGSEVVSQPSRIRTCEDRACTRPLGTTVYRYDGTQADDASALAEGAIGLGNLKRTTHYVYDLSMPGSAPTTVEGERYAYDGWGNRTITVQMMDTTDGMRSQDTYDPRWLLYPVTTVRGLTVPGGRRAAHPLTTTRLFDLARGLVTLETDPDGQATSHGFDAFGRPLRDERVAGTTRELVTEWAYFYYSDGVETMERHWQNAVRSQETYRRFDGLGRPWRTRTPLGPDAGNRNRIDDETSYDDQGRKLAVVDAHEDNRTAPMTSYYLYDNRGRVERTVRTPLRANNAVPSATEVTSVAGNVFVTRYTYGIDAAGLHTRLIDARHNQYAVAALSTHTVQDVRGHVLTTEDQLGRRVDFTYDRLGNLVQTSRTLSLTGESCTGAVCNTSVPVMSTMSWDSLGRRLTLWDPDKGWIHDSYDFAGHPVRSERADIQGGVYHVALNMSYDVAGRVTRRWGERLVGATWTADPDVSATYAYDSTAGHPSPTGLAGRLASVVDPTGTTFYGYDLHGRAAYIGKTLPGTLGTHSVRRTFGRSGALFSINYDGRETVDYAYNSASWLSEVSTWESSFGTLRQHDYYLVGHFGELGRPELVYRDDTTLNEQRAFNAVTGQLTSLQYGGPNPAAGPLLSLSLSGYDANGNLTTMRDVGTRTDYNYTYDDADQLVIAMALRPTGATGQAFQYRYVYDNLGNLRRRIDLAAGTDSRVYGFADDGTRPHAALWHGAPGALTPLDLSYVDGNLTSEGSCSGRPPFVLCTTRRSFAYSTDDKLLSDVEGGLTVRHAWDGHGEHAMEQRQPAFGAGTTRYDLGGLLEVETQGTTTTVSWNIFAGDRRLTLKHGDAARSEEHFLADPLGSVRVTTDRYGSVLSHTDYLPYGKVDAGTQTGSTRFAFTGQERAASVLLYGYRFYDPELGRFLSPDTVVPGGKLPIAFNRYGYGSNNPVNRIDPDGHNPLLVAALIGALIGGALGAYEAISNDQPIWKGILIGAAAGALGGLAGEGLNVLGAPYIHSVSGLGSQIGLTLLARSVGHGIGSFAISIGRDLAANRPIGWGRAFGQLGLGSIEGMFDTFSDWSAMSQTEQMYGTGGLIMSFVGIGAASGFVTSLIAGDNVLIGAALGAGRSVARGILIYKVPGWLRAGWRALTEPATKAYVPPAAPANSGGWRGVPADDEEPDSGSSMRALTAQPARGGKRSPEAAMAY